VVSTSVLGHAVSRVEDPELLRGRRPFVADLSTAGVLHARFVRSSAAHASIRNLDVAPARRADGVVAVFTAADLDLPGLGEFPPPPPGSDRAHLRRPVLARERVRFVGEAIAVVVATSEAAAADAAELVEVDLDPLPALVDPLAAVGADAPLLFPEAGTNVVIDLGAPGPAGTAGTGPGVQASRSPWYAGSHPLGEAAGAARDDAGGHTIRARFHNQRVAPVPLEPSGVLARPGAGGRLTVWTSTQAPFGVRAGLCGALGLSEDEVRVIAPAVGGGFGAKGGLSPEQVVVAAAALALGRPVRWVETRSENLVAMAHGRGQVQDVELTAGADGTFRRLRAHTVTDVGAYPWRGGIPTRTARLMANGPYRLPALEVRSLAVVTNTTPVGPYRGAGRPEATSMLERAVDLMAAELGMDPVELRRRNLLRPEEFPYETATGASYDSGDYAAALDAAVDLVGYDELRATQRSRRRAGDPNALGIGVACFCEISGSGSEYGAVRVGTDGAVTVTTGASPHGQGHETTLAQVVAEVLGVGLADVRVVHSDTAAVPRGVGTFGSRSGQLAGSAAHRSAEEVLTTARDLAARLLEADPADIVADGGRLSVAGVPARGLGWAELAREADAAGVTLAAEDDFAQAGGTYPFGTHVAVVEVDTETGRVALRRLVAVDDCGTVVNPIIVAGQVHGGLAQGVAQALFEAVSYDAEGNPLTATLIDYLVPSAADLPSFELGETVTPSPRNPLGVKGIGESGSVGATAAVQLAVLDALRPFGVVHLDPPYSPERVWTALVEARRPPAS